MPKLLLSCENPNSAIFFSVRQSPINSANSCTYIVTRTLKLAFPTKHYTIPPVMRLVGNNEAYILYNQVWRTILHVCNLLEGSFEFVLESFVLWASLFHLIYKPDFNNLMLRFFQYKHTASWLTLSKYKNWEVSYVVWESRSDKHPDVLPSVGVLYCNEVSVNKNKNILNKWRKHLWRKSLFPQFILMRRGLDYLSIGIKFISATFRLRRILLFLRAYI